MERSALRLAVITAEFPYSDRESFAADELAELGARFDVTVIPARPRREDRTRELGAAVRALRLPYLARETLTLAARASRRDPRAALAALAAVLAAPRALHAKLKNAAIFLKALATAERCREMRIEHVHGYWLTTPATIAYVVSRLNGIPWSATAHRHDLVDANVRTIGRRHAGFIPSARFVRTISRRGERQLRDALGRKPLHLATAHLGVRIGASAPAAQPPGETALRLICAANLETVKGHDVLLEALARTVRLGTLVRCCVVGDGTLRRRLEARSRALGLEPVVFFAGSVEHQRLLEALRSGSFDAAILTSRDDGPQCCEGIPVFLLEGMAAGLPAIATRSGGVAELVNRENGILCDPGDVDALARGIEYLACNREARRLLGEGARRTVEREWNVRSTAAQLAALIARAPEARA